MNEQSFPAKAIIFREGEMSDCAYVLLRGKVEILKHGGNGEVQLAVLETGSTFGEMGLFEPKSPRSATARAMEDVVLDVISAGDFHNLVNQCPPRLLPVITNMVERLRQTNVRVTNLEQATVILESDIDKIVMRPGNDPTGSLQPIEIPVGRLPIRIGGHKADEAAPSTPKNHFSIPCEGPPLKISSHHCEVVIDNGGIFLIDIGSRFGTVVNGRPIGRGRGIYKMPLQKGDNEVRLGGIGSPYSLVMTCV